MKKKEPIRIREKRLNDGSRSLYLDIYWRGRRKYEFLRLYLVPERTKIDRQQNRQTYQTAEIIKAKRIVELQNNQYEIMIAEQEDVRLFDYFDKVRKENCAWNGAKTMLMKYEHNKAIRLRDIDKHWCEGFVSFLHRQGLKENTEVIYISKLTAVMNQAVKDELITRNPVSSIEKPRLRDTERSYLQQSEVRKLVEAECRDDAVKRAFLFSCLTGLRYSDVKALTWGDVVKQGAFTRIVFRQQKTREQEYLDVNEQAGRLMGERRGCRVKVFALDINRQTMNSIIGRWVRAAGIDKHITFHCARHTFAVMMLDIGTDIYTVSKLLGHRRLETTQVYAKVLDKNKQRAVAAIPQLLTEKEEKEGS